LGLKLDRRPYVEEDRGYETPCWIWTGSLTPKGYGQMSGGRRAHKVFFERECGPVPEGLQLDHLCHQRACVRPDHQEPVTGAINVRRGDRTPLTARDVRSIRTFVALGMSQAKTAALYSIGQPAVSRIVNRRRWSDA
jgi:hypothetical protein